MKFKIMAIYSENHMTAINIIWGWVGGGQNADMCNVKTCCMYSNL